MDPRCFIANKHFIELVYTILNTDDKQPPSLAEQLQQIVSVMVWVHYRTHNEISYIWKQMIQSPASKDFNEIISEKNLEEIFSWFKIFVYQPFQKYNINIPEWFVNRNRTSFSLQPDEFLPTLNVASKSNKKSKVEFIN